VLQVLLLSFRYRSFSTSPPVFFTTSKEDPPPPPTPPLSAWVGRFRGPPRILPLSPWRGLQQFPFFLSRHPGPSLRLGSVYVSLLSFPNQMGVEFFLSPLSFPPTHTMLSFWVDLPTVSCSRPSISLVFGAEPRRGFSPQLPFPMGRPKRDPKSLSLSAGKASK